jgi:hypothetical protein
MTSKMNPDIKTRWVEAIRSGDYTQGTQVLYRADTECFCCLGVLTDLYLKENDESWALHTETLEDPAVSDGDVADVLVGHLGEDYQLLPTAVCQWAGIRANPALEHHEKLMFAAQLNDDGVPFAELAALIEAQL